MKPERYVSLGVVLVVMLVCMAAVRATTVRLVEVHAVVGSENLPFFDDQRVKDAFASAGVRLDVSPEGSLAMATTDDTCRADLALPSSSPAAEGVQGKCPVDEARAVFTSPMVVVTFEDIVPLLQREGIAVPGPATGMWTFNMRRYLDVVQQMLAWNQIPGNASHPSPNLVLLATTDPRTSNSAAMYAGMASYVRVNQNRAVSSEQVVQVAPFITQNLFLNAGYSESSTQYPFDQYVGSLGEDQAPMTLAYEAQFLDLELNHPETIANKHMVVMYPDPTVAAVHTVVSFTDKGRTVGNLLRSDPTLLRLEAEHGFRTTDPADTFTATMRAHGVTVPDRGKVTFANLPRYGPLKDLMGRIQDAYGH